MKVFVEGRFPSCLLYYIATNKNPMALFLNTLSMKQICNISVLV